MDDIILNGDVYACLEKIDQSIAVAITSPPYWKQRDYGYEGQIGVENTLNEYIGRLVVIYDKLRHKLRNNGVFFLNVGDKYHNQYGKSHLLQIPYRLGYHMVKSGWNLEDIIIWFKPNHMPSSVKDRFANTYEPVLVFTKNKNNIYKKGLKNVVKIPLQMTPWKHTATFPEKLIEELLSRINLKNGDIVLDPFAGTGTVAVVTQKMRSGLSPKKLSSIMIEKGDEFIKIIHQRTNILKIKKIKDIPYSWKPVIDDKQIESTVIEKNKNNHGEVFIARSSREFLSVIRGINSDQFRKYHREDALFFFGVRNWTLKDLYYISGIFEQGYVLRNMLIISNNKKWYPVFMFAKDSTIDAYKFNLDCIRTKPKNGEYRDWKKINYIGMKVSDSTEKEINEGYVIQIIDKYVNGFPKKVIVQWNTHNSNEFVLDPERAESLMEGLIFKCQKCKTVFDEPYDINSQNKCAKCGSNIWDNLTTLPLIEEPKELQKLYLKNNDYNIPLDSIKNNETFNKKKNTSSKFSELKRINWGASPGARKIMIGDYFAKMRLYRMDQPTVAQCLKILKKHNKLSINEIISKFPPHYKHTIGHWFRQDFGGSIPIPKDVRLLKQIFDQQNNLFDILEKTTLKFQTVATSEKGRNPGDYIELQDSNNINAYFHRLFMSKQQNVNK